MSKINTRVLLILVGCALMAPASIAQNAPPQPGSHPSSRTAVLASKDRGRTWTREGELGVERVLTSGQAPTAREGIDRLKAQPDVPGMRDVVDANRSGTKALLGRLHEIDTRSDALRPPVMQQAPPPPQTQDTPVADRWGSVAMMLAGFAGLGFLGWRGSRKTAANAA